MNTDEPTPTGPIGLENFFEQVLDAIQDGLSVLSPDMSIVYTNKIMEQWYDLSMPLVGKKCYQAYHDADKVCDPCPVLRCLDSKKMEADIVPGLPGSPAKWLELFAFPLFAEDSNKVVAVVEYVRDVTARNEAEQRLQERNRRLALLDEINQAVLRAGSLEECMAVPLDSLRTFLGASRVSVVTLDERQGRAMITAVSQERSMEPRVGSVVPIEIFGPTADLDTFKVKYIEDMETWPNRTEFHAQIMRQGIRSVLLVPMIAGKELIGIINIGSPDSHAFTESQRDTAMEAAQHLAIGIHQARLVDQIRRQKEDMEIEVAQRTRDLQASNKELEDFAYSVSHDLRAPLRAIRGFGEIIAQRHRDSLDEEGRHYFDNIVEAAGRMERLISDLLAYSKMGRVGHSPRRVDLSSILADVLAKLQGTIAELDAEIHLPDKPFVVMANPILLEQIFSNLIDNALKYHRRDVRPQIDISTTTTDEEFVISVTDNGLGIDLRHLDKIFNIFHRLHSAEEYPGTGIGLATVRKAAHHLGGRIEVTSQPGKGSIFSLHLPR